MHRHAYSQQGDTGGNEIFLQTLYPSAGRQVFMQMRCHERAYAKREVLIQVFNWCVHGGTLMSKKTQRPTWAPFIRTESRPRWELWRNALQGLAGS